jgi:hypothetical protein
MVLRFHATDMSPSIRGPEADLLAILVARLAQQEPLDFAVLLAVAAVDRLCLGFGHTVLASAT